MCPQHKISTIASLSIAREPFCVYVDRDPGSGGGGGFTEIYREGNGIVVCTVGKGRAPHVSPLARTSPPPAAYVHVYTRIVHICMRVYSYTRVCAHQVRRAGLLIVGRVLRAESGWGEGETRIPCIYTHV